MARNTAANAFLTSLLVHMIALIILAQLFVQLSSVVGIKMVSSTRHGPEDHSIEVVELDPVSSDIEASPFVSTSLAGTQDDSLVDLEAPSLWEAAPSVVATPSVEAHSSAQRKRTGQLAGVPVHNGVVLSCDVSLSMKKKLPAVLREIEEKISPLPRHVDFGMCHRNQ